LIALNYSFFGFGLGSKKIFFSILCSFPLLPFLSSYAQLDQQAEFVSLLLKLSQRMLTQPPFKDSWVVMCMMVLRTTFKILNLISHLPPNPQLTKLDPMQFHDIVALLLEMATTSQLQLEKFSQFKLQFVRTRYGDLREPITELLIDLWPQFPRELKHKNHEAVFRQALVLSQNGCDKARDAAKTLYSDMLLAEYASSHSIKGTELLTINSVNALMEQGGDLRLRELLDNTKKHVSQLNDKVGFLTYPIFFITILFVFVLMLSLLSLIIVLCL
jgi:hypothetical protein